MSVAQTLEQRLSDALNVQHLVIENESHKHSGPATESHFKLTLVSDDFDGKRLVQRHQVVYGVAGDLMQNPIHALAMHLFTASEWEAKNGQVMPSPNCLGGSKG